jgi:hypothetical protein
MTKAMNRGWGLVLLGLVLAIAPSLTGCGDDTKDANSSAARDGSETFAGGDEPLDSVQALLDALLVDQIGGALGGSGSQAEGLEQFVTHLTNALQYLLELPDDILAGILGGDTSGLTDVGATLPQTLTIVVDELLCAINSLAAQNCGDLNAAGIFLGLTDLELVLVDLQDQLGAGGEADLSSIVSTLVALSGELSATLADVESQLGDAPLAASLFELLAVATADVADLLEAIGAEDSAAGNQALVAAVDHLLNNLVIGLLDLDSANPQLADQLSNELQIVVDAVEQLGNDIVPFLIDSLLDPLTDLVGPLLEGLLGGLTSGLNAA